MNLQKPEYLELNHCCSQIDDYWIGLVDRGNCPQNARFRWNDFSECTSASPLFITSPPKNFECSAVVIQAGNGQFIPAANERACAQHHRYICQFPSTAATKPSVSTFSSVLDREENWNSDSSSADLTAIASVIFSYIFFLSFLALLCYWRYKKFDSTNIKNCCAATEQTSSSPAIEKIYQE